MKRLCMFKGAHGRLGRKPIESVNKNTFWSYMFADFETPTEMFAQLNLSTPFFFKPTDKICLSSSLNFFIHIANQVDAKRLDIFFHGFKMPKLHQMIGPKHRLA